MDSNKRNPSKAIRGLQKNPADSSGYGIAVFQILPVEEKTFVVKILSACGAVPDAGAAFDANPRDEGFIIRINGPHGTKTDTEAAMNAVVAMPVTL